MSVKSLFNQYIENTMDLVVQELDNSTKEFIVQRLIASIDMIYNSNKKILYLISVRILRVFEKAEEMTRLQIAILLKNIIPNANEKIIKFIFKVKLLNFKQLIIQSIN